MTDNEYRRSQIAASMLTAEANLMAAAVANVAGYGKEGRGQFLDMCAGVFDMAVIAMERMEKGLDGQFASATANQLKSRS